jgi:demethylmenaquinone methyltransferase/2-methoxy-6-polyprenyl-1,4-benzoquinol methylase
MDNNQHILKEEKKVTIGSMFDSIAWRYDFLNHFLSFGIDRLWRRKAIRIISKTYENPRILDVATGTGDLAIAAMKLNPVMVTGIDVSEKMLEIGRKKIKKKNLSDKIDLIKGDSENITFSDNTFDIAMVAFGVRNFSDPIKGLSEMIRVTRQGGLILILEFSKPAASPFIGVYNFYFRNLLPYLGRIFSKDRKAYRYLHESVMEFPDNENFMKLMKIVGLSETRQVKLTGGIATIYTGVKG